MRGKLFNNYKKYKLHVVKKMFRAHYNVQNLIAEKSCFFENKLTQCAGKVKDLGKAGGCVAGALTESQAVKQYQFNFKKFLFKSDLKFVGKIPQAPNRYAINFASDIYRKIAISENFK